MERPAAAAPTLVMRRAFVSSTSVDLARHRDAVRRVLERMDQFPVIMENFGAHGTGDATSVSLEELASAQVYIGIYAWRYGYVPPGSVLSVTHQEYRGAADLPRYIFLADPTTDPDLGPDALFPASACDPEHRDALLAFRQEVGMQVVDFFTTPDDLASKVATALTRYLLAEQWKEYLATAGRRVPRLLPPKVEGFVGRSTECETLYRALRQGESIGVAAAVSGMGGVGKSALAAEVVHLLAAERDRFPAGIAAVRCDSRTGLDGLAWMYDQLVAAWEVKLSPEELAQVSSLEAGAELRERALRRLLRPPSIQPDEPSTAALVLLDNVEPDFPLRRALEVLTPLGVTCLLTMRHRAALPSLLLLSLEVLEPAAAVDLFAERYRAQGGDWDATQDLAPTLQVVEHLGRLPLAIELAAARCALVHPSPLPPSLPSLALPIASQPPRPVEVLAQELDEANRLGKLGKLGDPLDPTRSVRYVLSRSLETLTPEQRLRFAVLGLPASAEWPRSLIEDLFENLSTGMIEAAAPEKTTQTTDNDRSIQREAADDLELFVALSLVTLVADLSTAHPAYPARAGTTAHIGSDRAQHPGARVRIHPLLRNLAHGEWQRQTATTRRAGALAFLEAVSSFVQQNQHDFAALDREEDVVVGAIQGTAKMPEAADAVVRLIDVLDKYLHVGGHWRRGLDLYQVQLAIYREVGDRRGEGTTLNGLGLLAAKQGRTEEALAFYQQALAIHREVGDRAGEGRTLHGLGYVADSQGRTEEALAFYQQALTLFEAIGMADSARTVHENLTELTARAVSSDIPPVPESSQPPLMQQGQGQKQRRWFWRKSS